jgi:acyl carrier protein
MLKPIPSSTERIADIVHALLAKRSIARPASLTDDLRDIGISSLDMVNLMLAVESEFDLTIPDAEMTPVNFRSIASIEAVVRRLTAGK